MQKWREKQMKTSNNGIVLIKKFEGCRLRAYDDMQPSETITNIGQVRGTLTIGYGHTGSDVYVGQRITQSAATNILKRDLVKFEKIVAKSLKVPITQNMFDALVSHAYNCGNIKMIAACLNKDDIVGAISYCLKPNTSKGIVLAGLTKRRKEEQALFCTGMYLKPTQEVNKETATNLEVRWIQHQLKITEDGCWGPQTANAIKEYRIKLGWKSGDGYMCTDKLIEKLK